MSQENVELIQRINEAFNRGDFEPMFALADPPPEFEYVPSLAFGPDLVGVQRGREGFRRVVEGFWDEFDDSHIELHEVIDAGDQVFISATFRRRGKHSGAETSWGPLWAVWVVRDGRVVRWQGFADRDAALEAAGLREEATSQEKVDVVRRMLRAFNDGDIEAIVAECDPAVEWEEQSIPGLDPLYRGHEGVRRWWAAVGEALGSLEGRLAGLREVDDAVLVSVLLEGEGASSGVRVRMDVHMVATFRDDKVVRRQVFPSLAEALEAAGAAGVTHARGERSGEPRLGRAIETNRSDGCSLRK
jgi:ketosteroid isomerase-like protein